jgi:hypothetical protein
MRQAMPQNNHNARAGQKCFLTADEHGWTRILPQKSAKGAKSLTADERGLTLLIESVFIRVHPWLITVPAF